MGRKSGVGTTETLDYTEYRYVDKKNLSGARKRVLWQNF